MLDYKQLFEYLQEAVSFQLIFSCFIVEKQVALETEDIQENINKEMIFFAWIMPQPVWNVLIIGMYFVFRRKTIRL